MSVNDIPFAIRITTSGTNLTTIANQFREIDTYTTNIGKSLDKLSNKDLSKTSRNLRGVAADLSKGAASAAEMDKRVRSLTGGLMTLQGALQGAGAASRNLRFDPAQIRVIDQTAQALTRLRASSSNPRDFAVLGRGIGTLNKQLKQINPADLQNLNNFIGAISRLASIQFNGSGANFKAVASQIRVLTKINVPDPTRLARVTAGLGAIAMGVRHLHQLSAQPVNIANINSIVQAVNNLKGLRFNNSNVQHLSRAAATLSAIGVAVRGLPQIQPAQVTAISHLFTVLTSLKVPRNLNDLGTLMTRLRAFMVGLNAVPIDPTKVGALTAVTMALSKLRMGAKTPVNMGAFFTGFNAFVAQMASKLPVLRQLEKTLLALAQIKGRRINFDVGSGGAERLRRNTRAAEQDMQHLRKHAEALRGSLASMDAGRLIYNMHTLKRTLTDLRFFLLGGGLTMTFKTLAGDLLKANGELSQLALTMQYTMTRPGQSLAEGFINAQGAMALFKQEANQTGQPLMEMYRAGTGMASVLKAFGMNSKQNLVEAMNVAQRLAAFDPAQGLVGANIAMREAFSGDYRSLRLRFEIPNSLINELKGQGLNAIQVIDQAMNRMGITRDLVVKSAQTFNGQMQRLKNNFFDFFVRSSNEVTGNLTRTLDGVNKQLERFMGSKAGQQFSRAFSDTFVALGASVSRLMVGAVTGGARAFTSLSTLWRKDTYGIASAFKVVGNIAENALRGISLGFAAFGKSMGGGQLFAPLVFFGRLATLYLPRALENLGGKLGRVFKAIQPGLESLQIAFVRIMQAIGMGLGNVFSQGKINTFTGMFNSVAMVIRRAAESLTMNNKGAELVRSFMAVSVTLRLMNTTFMTIFHTIRSMIGLVTGFVRSGPMSLIGRVMGNSKLPTGAMGAVSEGGSLLDKIIGGTRGLAYKGLLRGNSFLVGLLPMLAGPLGMLSRVILGPVIGGGLTFIAAALTPVLAASLVSALSPVAGKFIQSITAKIPLIGPFLSKMLGTTSRAVGGLLKNVINSILGPDTFEKIKVSLNNIVTGFVDMIAYAFGQKVSPVTGKPIGTTSLLDPVAAKKAAQDTLRLDRQSVTSVMGGFSVTGPDFSAARKLPGMANMSDTQLVSLLSQVYKAIDGGTTNNTAELWAAIKRGGFGSFNSLLKNYTNGDLGGLVNAARGGWAVRGGFTDSLKRDTLMSLLSGQKPESMMYTGKTFNPAIFGRNVVKMSDTDAATYNFLQQKIRTVGLTPSETAKYRNLQRRIGDKDGTARMISADKYTGATNTIPYGNIEEVLAYQGVVGANKYIGRMGGVPTGLRANQPNRQMFGYLQELIRLNGGDASKVGFGTVQSRYGALYKTLASNNKQPGAIDPAAAQMSVMLQILRESGVNLDAIRRSSEDIKKNTKPGVDTSMFDSRAYALFQANLSKRKGWEETWARQSKIMVPDIFSVGTAHKADFEASTGGAFRTSTSAGYASQYIKNASQQALEGLGIKPELLKGIADGLKDAFSELKGKLGIEEFVGNLVEGAKNVKEFGKTVKGVTDFIATFQGAMSLGYAPWDALKLANRESDGKTLNDIHMFLSSSGQNGGRKVSKLDANVAANMLGQLSLLNPELGKLLRSQLASNPTWANTFATKASVRGVYMNDLGMSSYLDPAGGQRRRDMVQNTFTGIFKDFFGGTPLKWGGRMLSTEELKQRYLPYDATAPVTNLPDLAAPGSPSRPFLGPPVPTAGQTARGWIKPPNGMTNGAGRIPGLPDPQPDGTFGGAIIAQAYKSLTDTTSDITGQCSIWVRQVIEKTLGFASGALQGSKLFGSSALDTLAKQRAVGLTRSFKQVGVNGLKNGDLLFSGNHVGIFMNGMVLENTFRRTGGVSGRPGARGWVTLDAFKADNVSRLSGWDGRNDWGSAMGFGYSGGKLPAKSPYSGANGNPIAVKPASLLPAGASMGGGKVNQAFLSEVVKIGGRFGINPAALMGIMDFETGGKFGADTPNTDRSAFGLMQFTGSSLTDINKMFGTKYTLANIQKMTALQQLQELVPKYLALWKKAGKLKPGASFSDLYMSVLFPAAAGKPDDTVLFGKGAFFRPDLFGYGTDAWKKNGGMRNGQVFDPSITKGEMARLAASRTKWLDWSDTAGQLAGVGGVSAQAMASAGNLWSSGAISFDAAQPSAAPGTISVGDDIKVSFSFGDIKLSGAATDADAKKFAALVANALQDPSVQKKLMDALEKARRRRGT